MFANLGILSLLQHLRLQHCDIGTVETSDVTYDVETVALGTEEIPVAETGLISFVETGQMPADVQWLKIHIAENSLPERKTSVLSQQQTSVLSQQQTSVLSQQQTSVLSQQKTSVLSQQQTSAASEAAWRSWRGPGQKWTKNH